MTQRRQTMFMSRLERMLMNNPVRAALQRRVEAPALLRMGGPVPGARALEIGCGRGVGALLILELFGARTVDVFDCDARTVGEARRRLTQHHARPRAWVGDAAAIPATDGSYDAVFDFGVLHHLPDWRAGVRELARVLRPGGRLYGEEVLGKFVAHPVTRALLDHPPDDRFDADELRDELESAGFVSVVMVERFRRTFVWFVASR